MTTIGGPPGTVALAEGEPRPARPAAVPRRTDGRPGPVLDVDVHPAIAAGRRARYTATIGNGGGAEVQARLSVTLEDKRLRALLVPPAIVLGPGRDGHAELHLYPRRPLLLRRERQHSAEVVVHAGNGDLAAMRRVIFVQQRTPILWGLLLLALLAAAAAFGAMQLPRHATVPAVEGAASVATADVALRAAGLELDPLVRSRTSSAVAPGTILDQIPDPGARVDRGERVTLLVAVSSRRAVTPALVGRTPAGAAAILRAAGLAVGPLLPRDLSGETIVASQLPAAGARVPAGTAVTLFVRARRPGDSPRAGPAGPGAPTPTPAAGTAPAGDAVKIPAIDGRGVSEYARAVAAAGLVPKVIRAVDPSPLGTLVEVRPGPGRQAATGTPVRLLVAAGVPHLAFDTQDVVRVFDPTSGRTVREASPPQGKAVEPSWAPDGRRVLYRVGRRLLLVSARLADRGRIVYSGRTKYVAATFAPAPADGVVALVRRTGGDGDLCFARVRTRRLAPRCSADRRWDLGRAISWRRGGRELLVFGVRRGRPGTFGMLRYRTSRPFSTNPADWRGAIATDTSVDGRGVIAAAYSPSGRNVGLVTNVGLPRFQLLVTAAGETRDPGVRALPVRACELAWRPDGKEAAVVQSDDACSRPLGDVVRVEVGRPRQTVTVSSGGRHPAYQPLTYAGPKGAS